ncbi:LOW QUALITY PROTEIN: hypothetical protein U9M48_036906 [Paspalum notatum var. saurae]|uniref:CCHC-type domain-containing protein n=1 Tax=Paspalum notatum var. saurae TaxID=547442 RepID=A0AAQ3X8Q5_PASNO
MAHQGTGSRGRGSTDATQQAVSSHQGRDPVPHWLRAERQGSAGRDLRGGSGDFQGHQGFAHQPDTRRGNYNSGGRGGGVNGGFHPGHNEDRERKQYRPKRHYHQHGGSRENNNNSGTQVKQSPFAPPQWSVSSGQAAVVAGQMPTIISQDKAANAHPGGGRSGSASDFGRASASGLDTEVAQVTEGAKKAKLQCTQCGRRGHVVDDCQVPLYCAICESKTHVTHRCHLLKAPKPVAQCVGYGSPGLGFHYIPVSDREYNDTKDPSAWALVTVSGGVLSADQVKAELERLVPVPWEWDIKEHGENTFLTVFPSAMELARLHEFGEAKVKNHPEDGISSAKSKSDSRNDPMDEDDDLIGEKEKELRKNKDAPKDNTGQQQNPLLPENAGNQSLNHNQLHKAPSASVELDQPKKRALEQEGIARLDGNGLTANVFLGPREVFGQHCGQFAQVFAEPVEVDGPTADGGVLAGTDVDHMLSWAQDEMPSEQMLGVMADKILDTVVERQIDEIADRVFSEDSTQGKNPSPCPPIRRSKRREATADEDSLERAERLVALKNLEDSTKSGHLQGYILGSLLELVAESEQQAFHEVGVSGARNYVHGAKWRGSCNFGDVKCNKKLIGGHYQEASFLQRILSAMEHTVQAQLQEHSWKGQVFLAAEKGTAAGMAPHAHIAMYQESMQQSPSTMDRQMEAIVKLGNGRSFVGESAYQPSSFLSLPLAYTLDSGNVHGKVIVCELEGSTQSQLLTGKSVLEAGGAGMIVLGKHDSGHTTFALANVLPASYVNSVDAAVIREYVKNTHKPTASVVFNGTSLGTSPAPVVAYFSSRGPSTATPGILKPDIIGPGVNVIAAWPFNVGPPTGLNQTLKFNSISGTSMSAPHLSGIAAIIKGAHRDWSPAAIKSAIMTTAYVVDDKKQPILDENLNPAGHFSIGAGHVNPEQAISPGLIYDTDEEQYVLYLCGLGYTDAEVETITHHKVHASVGKLVVNRTVSNVGDASSSYYVNIEMPKEVAASVTPSKLEFTKEKEIRTFTVSLSWDPKKIKHAEGSFKWVSEKHVVRSPFVIF